MKTVTCFVLSAAFVVSSGSASDSFTIVRDMWFQNYVATSIARERWESGYFLKADYLLAPASIYRYDDQGRRVVSTRLSLPNATDLRVADLAVRPDGTMAAAVTAGAGDGGTHLVWLAPSGEVTRHQEISPFVPGNVDFAHDGTLWVAGAILDSLNPDTGGVPHDILRRYAPDGTLLQTALNSDTFSDATWPFPTYFESYLDVHADGVGFYSNPAQEFVELDLDGSVRARWPGLPTDSLDMILGFGYLPDGTVYLGQGGLNDDGVNFWRLDKETGEWIRIDSRVLVEAAGRGVRLLGTDGEFLVVGTSARVLWVEVANDPDDARSTTAPTD